MRLLHRPFAAALAIGLAAQALFCWRLAFPHKLVFDEVHYVPAARTLWSLSAPANVEHPLLGKALIGLGIALFGDNPIGWRALSTIAGTAVVLGSFAILWLVFGRMRTAVTGSVLVVVNMTVFVQARIAMLDGFMAACVVLALATLLWSARGSGAAVWRRWIAGAALLGLAVGCKWTALPYIAFAGCALLLVRRWYPRAWPGLGTLPALALLAGISAAAYLLTFLPAFFYTFGALTWRTLLPFQQIMFHQQTQVLPPHTYQSSWWTWLLDVRPIWYLYEPVDGAVRGILMIGNPAVIWGGLAAVLACGWAGWRGDRKLGALAMLWFGSIAMWAVIPKSLGFFYYYYLSSIWLPLVIAAAMDRWAVGRWRGWDEHFLLLATIVFVWFYPIIAAWPLADPQAFHRWMWLPSWP